MALRALRWEGCVRQPQRPLKIRISLQMRFLSIWRKSLKTFDAGIAHGTVNGTYGLSGIWTLPHTELTVIIQTAGILTTYRSVKIFQDLCRRDFAANAMAYSIKRYRRSLTAGKIYQNSIMEAVQSDAKGWWRRSENTSCGQICAQQVLK